MSCSINIWNKKDRHQIHFSDKDNFVAKISRFYSFAMWPWQQLVPLSKVSSEYSTDVRYCLQVEKNAQSALIDLYCRDLGQIGTTIGSHLNCKIFSEKRIRVKVNIVRVNFITQTKVFRVQVHRFWNQTIMKPLIAMR